MFRVWCHTYLAETDVGERIKLDPISKLKLALTAGGVISMVMESDMTTDDNPTKSVPEGRRYQPRKT